MEQSRKPTMNSGPCISTWLKISTTATTCIRLKFVNKHIKWNKCMNEHRHEMTEYYSKQTHMST